MAGGPKHKNGDRPRQVQSGPHEVILAPMHAPHASRRARLFCLGLVLASSAAFGGVGSMGGCGPFDEAIWICLNEKTGKLDENVYDADNYANGERDPCHCYDACGPANTCPILVDAGPPGLGCDAGDGGP